MRKPTDTPVLSRERIFCLQIAASLLLGLTLILLHALPYPWAQAVKQAATDTLQEDTDWETVREFSFVSALSPQLQAVFAPAEPPILLRAPVKGDIAQGEGSVAYLSREETVCACAGGTVFYAGGDQVWLLHENGYQTRYHGLSPTVKAGQKVASGESIGSVTVGETLELTLLQDGRVQDVTSHLADPA